MQYIDLSGIYATTLHVWALHLTEVLGYSALNKVEIHNRTMLNFYLGLPHILSVIYRNLLSFRCKNIFVHRKCMQIFYTNIILNFSNVGWLRATHQHFPNCCCPYILVYMVASNTTSHILFTSHLFGMWCDLLKCPPHAQTTFKIIIFIQFGLSKNYFTRIF